MELTTVWFVLIAVLWIGYLTLEGFDFGVGTLLHVLPRGERERRLLLNTIGPLWDGNEVWLIVAGGATFAAFPDWYATLFSGFYLPLLVVLLALIVRNLGFEYRSKRPDRAWRRRWDAAIGVGSVLPAFVWGVAFANLVRGVPIDRHGEYTGNLFTLLNPFGILGGLVLLAVFLTHGAIFLALKTDGDVRARARALAVRVGAVAMVLAAAFLAWAQALRGSAGSAVLFVLAAAALVAALLATARRREGWAFAGTFVAIALVVAGLFAALFPDVMPSTTAAAYSLTTTNASSSHYTLTVMTWVAAMFTPLVLAYQGWTYWVFRRRLSVRHIPADAEPDTPVAAGAGS